MFWCALCKLVCEQRVRQCDHSLAFFTRSWLVVVHLGVLVFFRFSWRIGLLLSSLFRNLANSWLFSLAHLGIYENEEWSHWCACVMGVFVGDPRQGISTSQKNLCFGIVALAYLHPVSQTATTPTVHTEHVVIL